MKNRHHLGSGFAVHKSLELYISEFNLVSERIAVLRINTIPLSFILICVYAPTEFNIDTDKDAFYEELD